ncbi:MAG: hypothetical protein ACI379_10290 [Nocardioides sp.]|uniref:hypothetical protein n=1 Tax=Nocardioides sp. TaxID=35761 RepID=UPI003F00D076
MLRSHHPFLVPRTVPGPPQETAMYAMYPEAREWGPARHDPENPYGRNAVQAALDLRDSRGPRPDDN